jgi:hypothetical protein
MALIEAGVAFSFNLPPQLALLVPLGRSQQAKKI